MLLFPLSWGNGLPSALCWAPGCSRGRGSLRNVPGQGRLCVCQVKKSSLYVHFPLALLPGYIRGGCSFQLKDQCLNCTLDWIGWWNSQKSTTPSGVEIAETSQSHPRAELCLQSRGNAWPGVQPGETPQPMLLPTWQAQLLPVYRREPKCSNFQNVMAELSSQLRAVKSS